MSSWREISRTHLQVERYFRYLHHVTWYDPRTSTRSRRFTSSRSRRASVLLLLAFSYSLLATSLSLNIFVVISPFARGPLSYSTDFVTVAGSVGICCTCRKPANNIMLHWSNIAQWVCALLKYRYRSHDIRRLSLEICLQFENKKKLYCKAEI